MYMDCHHMLWQKRHWKQGYARLLREHEFFKVMVPQQTLHRLIHSKIHDVPTPNGKDCKRAYYLLVFELREGRLSMDMRPSQRLDFLIGVWQNCPATCAILKWQQGILRKFGL